jgi:hypothetical protein
MLILRGGSLSLMEKTAETARKACWHEWDTMQYVGGSEKRTSTVVTQWTFWEEAKVGGIVAPKR